MYIYRTTAGDCNGNQQHQGRKAHNVFERLFNKRSQMPVNSVFRFLFLIQFFNVIHLSATTYIFDPAGDAKHPGRLIGQTFERTATLYFARQIKEHIATLDKKAVVLFARLPGEHKDSLEKAHFVLQYNPDLFIHIALYQTKHIKPQIHFYCHAQNNTDAYAHTLLRPLAHTHAPYAERSQAYAHNIYTAMQIGTERICDLHAPMSIHSFVLKQIAAPALVIEIGIQDPDNLHNCIAPLAQSIVQACTGKAL